MATSFSKLYVRPDLAGVVDYYARPVVLKAVNRVADSAVDRWSRDGLRGLAGGPVEYAKEHPLVTALVALGAVGAWFYWRR